MCLLVNLKALTLGILSVFKYTFTVQAQSTGLCHPRPLGIMSIKTLFYVQPPLKRADPLFKDIKTTLHRVAQGLMNVSLKLHSALVEYLNL